jgi:hypothetical protein
VYVRRGQKLESPLWWAVAHVFNHQTHHHGQITALLTQQGCARCCGGRTHNKHAPSRGSTQRPGRARLLPPKTTIWRRSLQIRTGRKQIW